MSLNFSNPMKQLNIIISGHYFPGFQAQRYMFRLMTFEVLKLVNQFGLYLFSRSHHPLCKLYRQSCKALRKQINSS